MKRNLRKVYFWCLKPYERKCRNKGDHQAAQHLNLGPFIYYVRTNSRISDDMMVNINDACRHVVLTLIDCDAATDGAGATHNPVTYRLHVRIVSPKMSLSKKAYVYPCVNWVMQYLSDGDRASDRGDGWCG